VAAVAEPNLRRTWAARRSGARRADRAGVRRTVGFAREDLVGRPADPYVRWYLHVGRRRRDGGLPGRDDLPVGRGRAGTWSTWPSGTSRSWPGRPRWPEGGT